MHSKAQREPARHSAVVDCKLVPLHNMRQNLPTICYVDLDNLSGQIIDVDNYSVNTLAVSGFCRRT